MTCVRLKDGFVCIDTSPVYEYDGFLFSVHRYFGPVRLRRDNWQEAARYGPRFWDMWEWFESLPAEQREEYRVG